MDNFSYLFWAYAIFWIALFIYVYSLVKKSRELKRLQIYWEVTKNGILMVE